MRSIDVFGDVVVPCAFVSFVGFVIFAIAQTVVGQRANLRCLHAGYPLTEVTYNFEVFCKKRLNQTDVVVPLRDVP